MKKKSTSFCDIETKKGTEKTNRSDIYRHRGNFRWNRVADQPYKMAGNGWSDIMRRVIIGAHGESAKFHVRYFEIAAGGYSSFEKHRHEHVVICVKGEGSAQINKTTYRMKFMDVVYIAPHSPHQFRNPYKTPFGFLCIVNAKRDRPVLLSV